MTAPFVAVAVPVVGCSHSPAVVVGVASAVLLLLSMWVPFVHPLWEVLEESKYESSKSM